VSFNPNSPNLQKAREAFGELPPEVLALGEPESVHPPSAHARMSERVSEAVGIGNPGQIAKICGVLAFVFPVLGLLLFLPYLGNVPFGKAPPIGWVIMPINGVIFALVAGGCWWHFSKKAEQEVPASVRDKDRVIMPGLMVYPSALVHVRGRAFTTMRWEDIVQIDSPVRSNVWRLTDSNTQQIDIPSLIEDEGGALGTAIDRVTAVMLPRMLQQVENNETVRFGMLGISKQYVYWKSDRAMWDELTGMRILTGSVYQLQVFKGSPIPWMSWNPMEAPNGQMVVGLIRRVAPPRLLVEDTVKQEH
jgi:hypothetical protein